MASQNQKQEPVSNHEVENLRIALANSEKLLKAAYKQSLPYHKLSYDAWLSVLQALARQV